MVQVFGYGSLISDESMRSSSPNATDIVPAFVVGFRRVFNAWDELGFTESNLDVGGIAHCALNAKNTKISK